MRVVQTVFGKFHHFHLARQLHQREMLAGIFSSYPRFKLRDQGIPMDLVHTFPYLHMSQFAAMRYGLGSSAFGLELSWWLALTLDGYVAGRLPDCDVFIGISGSGLKTGRLAQKRGGKYICDRGSSHIRYTNEILTEEYRRWGQEFEGVYHKHLTREDQEYEQSDAITVPSEFARRTYIEMGVPPEKLRHVAYGADLSRFSKVADPPVDSFEVLCVGQIAFQKGVPYLLEAFEKFRHPRKRLTMVGAVAPEMEQFLKGKQWEHVEFLGNVPHARMKDVMSRSHVVVFPSINDGFGMVIGEAMACGCPVISSENSGGMDLIKDGHEGYVVPIRDSASITDRLEQLAQDPILRETMGARSLERVASIGGWDTYGRNYVAVLEALTANRQEAQV